jgi:tRNA (guanine-N7-)-methyltransferase
VSELLNPKDFIITRKRKKYKFAKFHNDEKCFEFDERSTRPLDVVEHGAGTGLFSVALAEKYPNKRFLAVDVKADRLQKGAYAALEKGLTNIFFLRARADQLPDIAEAGSLEQIWVTFPDPFPKKRSAGRRLTHPTFLALYSQALSKYGHLSLKHDNPAFFQWSLEQLVQQKWRIEELTFDIHDSDVTDDAKILTTYEQRWLSEGRISQFVRAMH